jgi:hypothetical protein
MLSTLIGRVVAPCARRVSLLGRTCLRSGPILVARHVRVAPLSSQASAPNGGDDDGEGRSVGAVARMVAEELQVLDEALTTTFGHSDETAAEVCAAASATLGVTRVGASRGWSLWVEVSRCC